MDRPRHLARTLNTGLVTLVAFVLAAPPAHAALPQFEQPGWVALTPDQKAILAPLEQEWGEMDAFRRKKWLGIASRFPDMSPEEQTGIKRNIREWARLAPEERKIAREKYKSLKRIAPDKRRIVRQKWEEYSALTDEEKERLRKKAPRQKKLKTPPKPSAPVSVSPVTVGKRVATPAITAPRSPISPIKSPQSALAPTVPAVDVTPPSPATPLPTAPGE
ncbi:hypothetical protein MASR1M60_05840 [Rhodocyclaceae bacterium]